MNTLSFRLSSALFVGLAAFAISTTAHAQIRATATFTDTMSSPGNYTYDVTLNNAGTTTIGTFWFGWIPGAGFLPATPTGVQTPGGWTDVLTNADHAIQWKTTSALLSPGQSLTGFIFNSTASPAALLGAVPAGPGAGDPITASFVYIAAPLADPGFQLSVTPAPVPLPASVWLLSAGVGGIAAYLRRRREA